MFASPSVFISFSEQDHLSVTELFAALAIQAVDVWDYSDAGQELGPGEPLTPALRAKIDSCDYFLAVISSNSIDSTVSSTPILEVRYAIDSGKAGNRVVPILLDDPPSEWRVLYKELVDLVWLKVNTDNEADMEDAVRRICERLTVTYVPPALLDPEVFFAKPFLKEIKSKVLKRAAFVQLQRYMNTAGQELLGRKDHQELWTVIKETVISFFGGLTQVAPDEQFFYPQIVRGVAELQLREFEDAERTFVRVTKGTQIDDEWLGLAYAGLGHTYFFMERFDDSVTAFQTAVELLPDDKKVRVNYCCALAYSGGVVLDDSISELLDDPTVLTDDRLKLLAIRGAIKYKQDDYGGVIDAFSGVDLDHLNESSAIYYAFALRKQGSEGFSIDVLENAAGRIKSDNLYHQLAHAHLRIGDTSESLKIYEASLLRVNKPPEFVRQVLVEYAQLVRSVEGAGSKKFRDACELAINFTFLPPPQSKRDCFFTGFAFYLLGRGEMAKHYFQCALDFASDYYDQLELIPV